MVPGVAVVTGAASGLGAAIAVIVRKGKPVTAEDIGSVQSDLIELSLLLEDSVMGIPAQDLVQGQGSRTSEPRRRGSSTSTGAASTTRHCAQTSM